MAKTSTTATQETGWTLISVIVSTRVYWKALVAVLLISIKINIKLSRNINPLLYQLLKNKSFFFCSTRPPLSRCNLQKEVISYTNEKNMATATSFPGARVEKTWSGEFGDDGKDRWKESEGASETEVSGQLTMRIME